MVSISEQKLLYHLTSLNNIGSILDSGLHPRSALTRFHDVADAAILAGRGEHGLDRYVPFHWFARNPFDGRIQKDRPEEDFLLITVRRALAKERNWKILPKHPLAKQDLKCYDYQEGFELINWDLMNTRDYSNTDCKSVCMAECLSPRCVKPIDFFMVYVRSEEAYQEVIDEIRNCSLNLTATINPRMFC